MYGFCHQLHLVSNCMCHTDVGVHTHYVSYTELQQAYIMLEFIPHAFLQNHLLFLCMLQCTVCMHATASIHMHACQHSLFLCMLQ